MNIQFEKAANTSLQRIITFGRTYVGQKGRIYLKVEDSKYLS